MTCSKMVNIANEYVKSLIGNNKIRFTGMLADRGQPEIFIGCCEIGTYFSVTGKELPDKKAVKENMLKSLRSTEKLIAKLILDVES